MVLYPYKKHILFSLLFSKGLCTSCLGIYLLFVATEINAQDLQSDTLRTVSELQLNRDAVRSIDLSPKSSSLLPEAHKPWLEFDNSLPTLPKGHSDSIRLTLYPYTANTPYNYDPVLRKYFKVYGVKERSRYPFMEKKYLPAPVPLPHGVDLMKPFTKEFWQFKLKKNREKTRILLKEY